MILGLLIIPWISFMRPWLDRFLLAVAHCDACNPLTIDINRSYGQSVSPALVAVYLCAGRQEVVPM